MLKTSLPTDRRTFLLIAVLAVIIGGVRFSDGSMLLAIAAGRNLNDPAFGIPATQYVWDSPMKIMLLQLLPPRILAIAGAFTVLALLPLAGLLAREASVLFFLTSIVVCITPAIKISFQNIGVGDGLVYASIIIGISATSRVLIFLSFLIIGLWHPHQAFFIGGSCLIFNLLYRYEGYKKCIVWSAGGLSAAALVYCLYRYGLGFNYYGRADYMIDRGRELFFKNLLYLPLSGFYLAFWLYLLRKKVENYEFKIVGALWLLLLIFVSMLTTDVTRALSLVALPALLLPLKEIFLKSRRGECVRLSIPAGWIALCLLFPVISWAGIDIFVWPDILKDLCKYGFYCP